MKLFPTKYLFVALAGIIFLFSHEKVYPIPRILAIPDLNSGVHVYRKWDSVIDYLKKKTNLDIKIMIVQSHGIIERGLQNKTISYAFVDPLWYVKMYREKLCFPLAKVEVRGREFQRSLLIVHKDSIIREVSDLKGKTVALVNRMESSAGYFIPLFLFKSLFDDSPNVDNNAGKYFKRVVFSDSYMSVLKGVAFGKLDGGFVSSNLLDRPDVKALKSEVRIIFRSDYIPQWIVIARGDLDDDFSPIEDALFEMRNDREGKKLLVGLGFSGFLKVTRGDYLRMFRYVNEMNINRVR